jgi:hypothetical protein
MALSLYEKRFLVRFANIRAQRKPVSASRGLIEDAVSLASFLPFSRSTVCSGDSKQNTVLACTASTSALE